MSAGASTVTIPPRFERASRTPRRELSGTGRTVIRLTTFAALGLYGALRWARLTASPPTGRLLAELGLAVVLVAAVTVLRRFGPVPAVLAGGLICLLALPVAGLPWHDFVHVKIAVSARHIGDGLAGLPAAIVPYSGSDQWVRTVITLGAAVLLLDAAVVLAFAPEAFGDVRRAGAALPLIALAVVPSTLVRPQLPYAQGLLLFVLLAAFLWAERLHRRTATAAVALALLAGVAGAIAAPRLDPHHALVNYRAWAGGLARHKVDAFIWNQTYGPLKWPRKGREVLTVNADRGDYWKATNLEIFNGRAWVSGRDSGSNLPPPKPSALSLWSQTIKVRITGMRTNDVIASGFASQPLADPAPLPGASDGTWVTDRALAPGASYVVTTYSPHPSTTQLEHAGNDYPRSLLDDDRAMRLPAAGTAPSADPLIIFPAFHAHGGEPTQIFGDGLGRVTPAQALARSPYAPVYTLARRLAAGARTPDAVALRIEHYLLKHYTYNENPPARPYPLVSFLFQDKIGYCQQFSGSMALLLRMAGIPARVSAGFTTGVRSGRNGPFDVTDIDAHAWVEAWFPGYAWVRFDPTPPLAPARGGHAALPIIKNLPGENALAPTAPRRTLQATPSLGRHSQRNAGQGTSPWEIVLVVLAVALLAWLIAGVRGGAASTDARVRELERAMARTGRPLSAGVTLSDLERRFRDAPAAAAYVRALRTARFKGGGAETVPGARRAMRQQLRDGLGISGRLRALWALPPRPGRP